MTSLNVWVPVMSTSGRTVTPGASIGQMKYEIPSCLEASGSVRASRMPKRAVWAYEVHTFCPWTTHWSPSELGPGGQRGQVRAGSGLAEQLAPDLLPGQQRE